MGDSDNDSGGEHKNPTNNNLSSPKEQDRFLPIANVSRIMKRAVPANAKISKDAKETVQECVSEFISFITGEASDKCQREKRKTINGDDLLWAMTTLGFEDYVEPLKVYLQRFRELEGEKSGCGSGGGSGSGTVAREQDVPGNASGFVVESFGAFQGHVYGSGPGSAGAGGVFNQMGGGLGFSGPRGGLSKPR